MKLRNGDRFLIALDVWLQLSSLLAMAISAALGQFLLASVLAIAAIGLFLRIVRRKRRRATASSVTSS
jgi:hypothetical protein